MTIRAIKEYTDRVWAGPTNAAAYTASGVVLRFQVRTYSFMAPVFDQGFYVVDKLAIFRACSYLATLGVHGCGLRCV
jgi:hypothetical protein